MRLGIVVGAFVTTTLVVGAASAAPHYLLARGVNQFNGAKAVQSPDLTGEVTGTFALGTPSDDVFVNGTAFTSSDTGTLKFNVGGGAKPAAGTTANTPNNWSPASRIQETILPGAKVPTKVKISFSGGGSGSIKTTQGGEITLSGSLKVDGGACSITFNQYVTSGVAKAPDVTNNCTNPKYEVLATPNSISIVAPFNGTSMDVDAQIIATVSYGGVGFDGTAEAGMEGLLGVSGVDGDIRGTSPTFLSKGPAPDAGAPGGDGGGSSSSSGGSSGGGSSSGGSSPDGGSSSGAAPGSDDGGGCNTGGAPTGFVGIGAPLAAIAVAAALARRSRRRRST